MLKNYFEEYLTYILAKGYCQKTADEHRYMLYNPVLKSVGEKKLKDLRLTDLAKVMQAGREHGKWGFQRSAVTLRRLLCYLHEKGLKLPFDWRDIKVPKIPKPPVEFLDQEELTKIRENIDITNEAGMRTRCLIEVLLDTGMRIGEAISMDKNDIDWEKKEAQIINVKTHEIEKVYFTDRSLLWIKKYLDFRNDHYPFLFKSGRGRMLSTTSRNWIRTHLQGFGIKKHIKHHIFRKTFATYLIKGNANIKEVQTLCRHSSSRTTMDYYLGTNREECKNIHQRIMSKIY